jgi:hypothetical protein
VTATLILIQIVNKRQKEYQTSSLSGTRRAMTTPAIGTPGNELLKSVLMALKWQPVVNRSSTMPNVTGLGSTSQADSFRRALPV